MPIYRFEFPDPLTGLAVTILDDSDAMVNTGTLGTPDGSGHISYHATLAAGNYRGRVVSSGLASDIPGVLIVNDELELVGSVEAAGSGGLLVDGTVLQFECNAGGTITTGIPFDTFYLGNDTTTDFTFDADSNTVLGVPKGVYVGFIQIDFDTPDKDYIATFQYGSLGGVLPRISGGGYVISASAANSSARSIRVPLTVIVEAGLGVLIGSENIQSLTATATVTPPTFSYADAYLIKIG